MPEPVPVFRPARDTQEGMGGVRWNVGTCFANTGAGRGKRLRLGFPRMANKRPRRAIGSGLCLITAVLSAVVPMSLSSACESWRIGQDFNDTIIGVFELWLD